MAVKPRQTDELRRITNLEPPCKHELRLGRSVRLRRLYELSRNVPGQPTRFYGESFVLPVGDDASTCGVLQFVTTNLQHSRPFSELFVAIANTVTLFTPDDETEVVHLSYGESSPSTPVPVVRTFADMAGRIVVDIAYVDQLKSNVDTTTSGLRGEGGYSARVPSAGRLNDALEDFMGKWDERRGELADSLDAVSSALGAISSSFGDTEDELVSQLEGG